jgi:hypothetical protein
MEARMDENGKGGQVPTDLVTPSAGPSPAQPQRPPALFFALLGALLVMLIGAVLVWQMSRPAGPGDIVTSPRLVVDRDVIDLGRVRYNQHVKAAFTLGNAGGRPLTIVGQPRVEVVKGC